MYYRGTLTENPMSEWGHAMFAESFENAYTGQDMHNWQYDGESGIDINDMRNEIINAWNEDVESGAIWNWNFPDTVLDFEAEDIFEMFNPRNIVDSADGYDDGTTLQWLCDRIVIPNDIRAIITYDGAVVFDAALIEKCERTDKW